MLEEGESKLAGRGIPTGWKPLCYRGRELTLSPHPSILSGDA